MFGTKIDIEAINHAFSPAKEIVNPELFVGRYEQIKEGTINLQTPGNFLVIYGYRGVGKSSIAAQLMNIAKGEKRLIDLLKLRDVLPRKGFDWLVHYVKIDGFVKDTRDLIKRILFGDENNPSLFSLTSNGEKRLQEYTKKSSLKGGGDVKIAKIEGNLEEAKKYGLIQTDDLIQEFRKLLGTIRSEHQNQSGILFVIDEFDTLKEKSEFSSLVKTCSSDFVKFAVIGIANDFNDLIKDHASIGRQVNPLKIPVMEETELSEIITRAQEKLKSQITMSPSAIAKVAKLSEGFPYFTHLIGKESFVSAFLEKKSEIQEADIDAIISKIAQGKLQTIYENDYHASVKNSPQREILLKLFAEANDDEIFSETIYAGAREFEITNPSQLMKELTAPENFRPVLTKVRDRYFRFSDPMFKVYARIRNWKFKAEP